MTSPQKLQVGLLVIDLDNTLWDWVDVWVESFTALLDGLVEETDLDREVLIAEMRSVHQERGTTEYSLLLDELPSLKPILRGRLARDHFGELTHKFNSIRYHKTVLYPGVLPTLMSLKARGVKVVAYTESIAYWTEWRIRRTGLDGMIDVLYSSPDSDFPAGVTRSQLRTLPKDQYGLKRTEHRHVEAGITKPDPQILEAIVAEHGAGTRGIAYLGDSLLKDVTMAQAVGVIDIHAAYGVADNRPEYQLLRDVTHWTDEMVERERDRTPGALPTPSYVLREGISEILELFDFGPELDVKIHLDLWKQSVDVQQHFNDLGWRIRALALTAMTFAYGATGFAYVNAGTVELFGTHRLAAYVPIVGLLLWSLFWFMDALWFHRLLHGAVRDGVRLERLLQSVGVRADLGSAIGRASPIGRLHSDGKLHLFYAVGSVLLALTAIILFVIGTPVAEATSLEAGLTAQLSA